NFDWLVFQRVLSIYKEFLFQFQGFLFPIPGIISLQHTAMICTAYISCCHNGKEQPDTARITLGMPLLDHLHNALVA
ncbi:hypothetical protein ACTND3_12005, partial [Bacillota bacterium HCP28S3_F12]